MNKQDSRPLLVRMPPELHEAVRAAASMQDLSMAQYARRALRDSLPQQNPK
jgi:predicted HicB family RNase H-like nuclease